MAAAPLDEALLRMLGLALRAGRLAVGSERVARMVARGKRPLVVIAADASPRQREKIMALAPVRDVWADRVDREGLARALGRDDLTVVALDDPDFLRGLGVDRKGAAGGKARRRERRRAGGPGPDRRDDEEAPR